ncbi:MAG TPA: ribonuclease P protein subunit [Candidatus Nitrosopolaris sp.]
MTIPESILAQEIVGLKAEIRYNVGKKKIVYGRIVFETKNMITIKTKSGVKKIAKGVSTRIKLYNPSGACFISGAALIGRPEDRVSRIMS